MTSIVELPRAARPRCSVTVPHGYPLQPHPKQCTRKSAWLVDRKPMCTAHAAYRALKHLEEVTARGALSDAEGSSTS